VNESWHARITGIIRGSKGKIKRRAVRASAQFYRPEYDGALH